MNKKSNARYIYDELIKAGATPEGACGLLGNLEAESGLEPTNLQNSYNSRFGMSDEEYTERVDNGTYLSFVNDAAGYGLAQWTERSRKTLFLNFIRARGFNSIGSLEGQTAYLIWELKTHFQKVWDTLCSSSSIKEASNLVLTRFEIPADQSLAVQNYRLALSECWYVDLVCNSTPPSSETDQKVEPTTGFWPPRMIDKNMVGSDVMLLQAVLNCRGYGCRIDGIFGSELERKVKAFQEDFKLAVDGVVGPKTWAALLKY